MVSVTAFHRAAEETKANFSQISDQIAIIERQITTDTSMNARFWGRAPTLKAYAAG